MASARFRPTARDAARLAAGGLAGSLLLALAPAAALAAPVAQAAGAAVPGDLAAAPVAAPATTADSGRRRMVGYTVRPGDTATGLAVRYHAWTDELIRINDLGPNAMLIVGQRIRIPVVVDAVRKHRATKPKKKQQTKPVRTRKPKGDGWHHADPSRATVRRTIVATARRYGVDPELALAVSWQEAGWQMHHVSSADAIGAMQVIPGTGVWMSMYAGRSLHLHRLRDNVLAGVLLLDVLNANTRSTRGQLAAYYQGLGALREHGMYDDTKRYVANVLAIRHRLERGWSPA